MTYLFNYNQKIKKMANENEVLITHVFNAPGALVFKAWTDPAYLKEWFAPDGCSIHFNKIDVREGGSFHSCISNPAYPDCWCIGKYLEIKTPERIVFSMAVADEEGNLLGPAEAGMDPDWPAETIVTVTFIEKDGKTTITLHQTVAESLAKRTGAHPSWIKMLVRLENMLKTKENKASDKIIV
jgi:uncharacterized protein YndB with AHSA1/START domain